MGTTRRREPYESAQCIRCLDRRGQPGEEIRQGIELAVDIINNQYSQLNLPLAENRGLSAFGGIPVQVIYADHQNTEAGARKKTRELITFHEVAALMGAYESDKTKIASEVAEGIPFLTATSTSPALTERGFQWFFRTTPTDITFVNNTLKFITDLNAERKAGLQRRSSMKVAILARESWI
ncbi:MAG: ABC transporter substrate-binding protein [Deltaproteobacteria bacterium]